MEQEDRGGEIRTTRFVKIGQYLTSFSSQGVGIVGQLVFQTYFHRPFQELLRPFLAYDMVITGLEETAFENASTAHGPLSWGHFQDIPPVLVIRLKTC